MYRPGSLDEMHSECKKLYTGSYNTVWKHGDVVIKECTSLRDRYYVRNEKRIHEILAADGLKHAMYFVRLNSIEHVDGRAVRYYDYYQYTLADLWPKSGANKPANTSIIDRIDDQLAAAVAYMHSVGVIHGDIKSENIVVTGVRRHKKGKKEKFTIDDTKFGVKLMDVDHAMVIGEHPRDRYYGTSNMWPPSYFITGEPSKEMDVWAVGCVIFEVLSGVPMFSSEMMGRVYDNAAMTRDGDDEDKNMYDGKEPETSTSGSGSRSSSNTTETEILDTLCLITHVLGPAPDELKRIEGYNDIYDSNGRPYEYYDLLSGVGDISISDLLTIGGVSPPTKHAAMIKKYIHY